MTSIEIDPDIATRARAALFDTRLGGVTVVTGDATLGYPPGAPYDRVIATAACQDIPYPWVEQSRPGGRILTPWANAYFDGGLMALTVGDDGAACGGIVSRSWFMWLRQQRVPRDPVSDIVCPDEERAELPRTWTDVHPHHVVGEYGAQLAISLRVSRCRHLYSPFDADEGNGMVWFIDPWSRSWASLAHTTPDASDGEFQVQQCGPGGSGRDRSRAPLVGRCRGHVDGGRTPAARPGWDRDAAVPRDLGELHGPLHGSVSLPARLFWSGPDPRAVRWDLSDPTRRRDLYEIVLVQGVWMTSGT